MKKVIYLIVLLFTVNSFVNAQCGPKLKQKFKANCKGIYLLHKEVNIEKDTIEIVLNVNCVYRIYLFKTEAGVLPNLNIYQEGEQFELPEEILNEEIGYKYVTLHAKKSGTYKMILDFDGKTDQCAVLALFFQKKNK